MGKKERKGGRKGSGKGRKKEDGGDMAAFHASGANSVAAIPPQI